LRHFHPGHCGISRQRVCSLDAKRNPVDTHWRRCTLWNALPASWLAGTRKGFVYWRPGLVTTLQVGSLRISSVAGQSKKKAATVVVSWCATRQSVAMLCV
jgi:hypothetical protein